MPLNATVTASDPYSGGCPSGRWIDVLLNILNNFTNVTVTDTTPGSTVSFVRQSATPTVQNGLFWKRISTDGVTPKPLGEYAPFNGRWVPANPPPIGTIIEWTGDPTGLFDDDGKGLFVPSPDTASIAGRWYGWQIANGNNGSRNLKNAFVIAAEKWDSVDGAAANWVASIPQPDDAPNKFQTSGGRSSVTLTRKMLPNLPVREYDAAGTATNIALYGGTKYTADETFANPRASGDAQVDLGQNYPLFRAVALLQFMGY